MSVDLTKLQSTSLVPGFKNNQEIVGSFTISGTIGASEAGKVITKTVTLPKGTDIADIMFKGRANGGFSSPTNDPRPNNAWFKRGKVWVRGDATGLSNYPISFVLGASIKDGVMTISARMSRQFTGTITLTAETVNYKIIDYSVF